MIGTPKTQRLIASLFIALFSVTFFSYLPVAAQANENDSLSSIGQCSNQSASYSTFLGNINTSGNVYIKLSNSLETSSPVQLYFQSFSNQNCQLIGSASPVYGQWLKIGSGNFKNSSGGAFILYGNNLGAEPYGSVAQVLIVPSPSICLPTTSCLTNYDGYSATLQPNRISGPTDEVAIYIAQPVNGVSYSSVGYYADGKYLYGSSQLKPFNTNYLSGGSHQTTTQVNLNNGETLYINKTINMGIDVTGFLWLKSLIYQTKNKALLFIYLAMVVIIIMLGLWIIHLIYRHRRYKIEHGLNKIPKDQEPQKPKDKIVVG